MNCITFIATSCNILQLPAASCCLLQLLLRPAASCCVLQLPATSCNFLLRPATSCCVLLRPATSCNILQLPAASCNFLQCIHKYALNKNTIMNKMKLSRILWEFTKIKMYKFYFQKSFTTKNLISGILLEMKIKTVNCGLRTADCGLRTAKKHPSKIFCSLRSHPYIIPMTISTFPIALWPLRGFPALPIVWGANGIFHYSVLREIGVV
jgi:hypothetical protein